MKNTTELRDLSGVDLKEELLSQRKDQFNLRMKKANGTLEKTHLINLVRKNIARIKQVMREKAGIKNV